MRAFDECSGPWVGWWLQRRLRGHVRMRLTIAEGRLRGTGQDDRLGAFEILGEYEGEIVRFGKVHPTHVVQYDGRWNGASLAGLWRIRYENDTDEGEFELWPEREGTTVEEFFARMDDPIDLPELVPA